MNTGFYTLKVKALKRETSECVSVLLDVPGELQHKFGFQPGQHLIFRGFDAQGEEIRRNYSICSCPSDQELWVAVKKIEGGYFSSYVNEALQEGDTLEVMAPQGKFVVKTDENNKKSYVAIAAGSGITPVISILKSVLRDEPESRFTLIFGNRNKASIIFKEEIEALKNRYMDRLSIFHVMSREKAEAEILYGRIDRQKIALFLQHLIQPKNVDEVFLCGPEQMIFESQQAFLEAGLDPNKIHFELFFSKGAEEKKAERIREAGENVGPISKIRLKLDGSSMEFDLAYKGDSILDTALKNGADLPYACKGGVCATCKCKLEEGEVVMDVNYALEPDELAQGFILACQSHPISPSVVINYDIK